MPIPSSHPGRRDIERPGLTCREVIVLATEYFEASLDGDAAEGFAAHVAWCEGCQTYLRQLRLTVDVVRCNARLP